MKYLRQILSLALSAVIVVSTTVISASAESSTTQQGDDWKLVFSDEFDGDSLDSTVWNRFPAAIDTEDYFFYGSTPETLVSPENAFVQDGYLNILAENEPMEFGGVQHQYKTGMVQTRDKVEITYGRFEARIKMPDLPGSNPAFWLMPHKKDGVFPFIGTTDASGVEGYGAEVDILEHIYDDNRSYQATVHWGGYGDQHKSWTAKPKPTISGDPYDWHVFAAEWTPKSIKFLIDGKVVATYIGEGVPYGPEFIIFSLGMGGNWIGTPDTTKMPISMLVDYVRVYQKDSYDPVKLADGTYTIVSEFNSKCLDLSTESGASNVIQNTANGSDSQKWIVSTAADEYRTIKNVSSGLALDVFGGQTTAGSEIIHWTDWGRDNQRWMIEKSDNDSFKIINKKSRLLLDIYGRYTTDGAKIIQWNDLNHDNQRWIFTPCD